MRRGDIVVVAAGGDYGKPRPAVVIQSERLPDTDSVLICLLTTTLVDAPLYRLPVLASEGSGLREDSHAMIEKITAVRRAKCRPPIGRLDPAAARMLDQMLALVIGLSDKEAR